MDRKDADTEKGDWGDEDVIDINMEHIEPSMDSLLLLGEETRKIIGCAFQVYNTLGSGFLEDV